MVHFGKYLERHLVAEWRDSYCNYKKLKKMLRRAAEEKERRENESSQSGAAAAEAAAGGAAAAADQEEGQLRSASPRHAWTVSVEAEGSSATFVTPAAAAAAATAASASAAAESPRRPASAGPAAPTPAPDPDPSPDAPPAPEPHVYPHGHVVSAVPSASVRPASRGSAPRDRSSLPPLAPPPPSASPPPLSVPTTPPAVANAGGKLRQAPHSARAADHALAAPAASRQPPQSARNAPATGPTALHVRVEEANSLNPSPLLFLAHRPEHLSHLRDYTRRASPLLVAGVGEASPVPLPPATSALLAPDFVLDSGVAQMGASRSPSPPPTNEPLQAFLEQLETDFGSVERFFHDHELRLEARFLALQSRVRQRRWGRVGDAGPSPDAAAGGAQNGVLASMVAAGADVEADADADADAENAAAERQKDGKARSRSPRVSPTAAAAAVSNSSDAPLLRANCPEAVELRELYHAALLLDNYRLLNATAFLKIAKKFDKQMRKGKNGVGATPHVAARSLNTGVSGPNASAGSRVGDGPATVDADAAATAVQPDNGNNEGNPPLHQQVQARLATADFSTSTRLDSLLDTMLHLYARAFETGTRGAGIEAALEAARRALDFPLPPVSAPDVRRAKVLIPLVSALVVTVIVLALWWQSVLDDVDAVAVRMGRNPRDSCMGQSLESGIPKCTGREFEWSLSSSLPVYRAVGVVILHLFLWSACAAALRRFRVNYVYLLEFDSATVVAPLRLFVTAMYLWVAFLLALVWQLGVWIHYGLAVRSSMEAGVKYPFHGEDLSFTLNAPHLFLMLFFVFGVLLNPAPVFLRSGRWWLIRSIGESVVTPFATLHYKHTWVTNQMSTVTRIFSDGAYALCFETVGASEGWPHSSSLHCTAEADRYWFWLSTLPSWWRMVQSFRRYAFQDRSARHIWNGIKYGNRVWVSVLAWSIKLSSTNGGPLDPSSPSYSTAAYDTLYNTWIAFTVINVAYSYWWDVRKDWGLEHIKVRIEPARLSQRAPRSEAGALLSNGMRDPATPAAASPAAGGGGGTVALTPSLWSRLQPSRIRLNVTRMLLLPHDLHWFYLLSMVFDCACRVASLASKWTDIIFGGGFNSFASTSILSALESVRRNWASFHRLENEHLCNSEKFREIEKLPAITPADFPEAHEAREEAEADAAQLDNDDDDESRSSNANSQSRLNNGSRHKREREHSRERERSRKHSIKRSIHHDNEREDGAPHAEEIELAELRRQED